MEVKILFTFSSSNFLTAHISALLVISHRVCLFMNCKFKLLHVTTTETASFIGKTHIQLTNNNLQKCFFMGLSTSQNKNSVLFHVDKY